MMLIRSLLAAFAIGVTVLSPLSGAPVITTPPAAPAGGIYAGIDPLVLSAEVSSTQPVTYQWSKDGVPLVEHPRISGVTSSQLTLATTLANDTGTYTLAVEDADGSDVASTYLLVRPQPAARSSAFFTLTADGVGDLLSLPDGRMLVALGNSSLSNLGSSTASASLAYVHSDGTVANLGFDPVTNAALPFVYEGGISCLLRQPDGKILIGGTFFKVNGIPRYRIARLHPDGSLDTSFDPGSGANDRVYSFHLDSSGHLYVAGAFNNFAGYAGKNFLVRLDAATGALDPTFTSGLNGVATELLPLPDGGFLVGGVFTAPQSYLCRFDVGGVRAASYVHTLTAAPSSLALAPSGLAFYASFRSAPFLGRFLLADGSADAAFSATGFNGSINEIAVQPDGKVVAFGDFTSPSRFAARVTDSGALDPLFVLGGTAPSDGNLAVALDPAGRIWFGGSNVALNGVAATRIAVFEGDLPPLAWAVQPSSRSASPEENVVFAAQARATSPVSYQWYKDDVALIASSRLTGVTGPTLSILGAIAADEGQYSCRATTAASGTIVSASAELIVLGSPEILTAPAGGVYEARRPLTVFVQARGVGPLSYQWFRGTSTSPLADIPGATSRTYTLSEPTLEDTAYYGVRITGPLGSVSSTPVLLAFERRAGGIFSSAPVFPRGDIEALISLPDGSYVAGGSFDFLNREGQDFAIPGLARILPDGGVDTAFPMGGYAIFDIVRDSQGRLVIAFAGSSIKVGGVNHVRRHFARILPDGTLDPSFVGPFNSSVFSEEQPICLAVDAQDRIYVGGSFTSLGDLPNAPYLIRLDAATGAHDATFFPMPNGAVRVIRPLPDGTVLAGGDFGLKRFYAEDGSPAGGFTYGGANSVHAILPVPSSTDFLLGTNNGLQRITHTGALVLPFPASGAKIGGSVTEMLPLPSGQIIVAGYFTANGVSRRIAAMDWNGDLVSGWSFDAVAGRSIKTLAYDPLGPRILVGGDGVAVLEAVTTTPADPGFPGSGGPLGAPVIQAPSAITNYGFTLNWTASPDATGYTLEIARDATFATGLQTFFFGISGLSYVVTDLIPGTTYYYRVTAQAPGGTGAVSETGTVATGNHQPQSLDFAPLAPRTFGDAPIELTATATSGLPVAFEIVSGPGSLSGFTLTITGAGSIVIRALQAGNTDYFPAEQERTLSVARRPQTITFPAIDSPRPVDSAPFALGASVDSGQPIAYTVVWGPATVSDGYLTITGVGSIRILASQAGDANHLPATSVFREFYASALSQQILFTQALPNLPVGAPSFQLTATAAPSGLPVSYQVSGVASLNGTTLSLTGSPGAVTITATQGGNAIYAPAANIVRSFSVTVPTKTQTIDFPAIPAKTFGAASFDLVATAKPSGLPVFFEIVSGPATLAGKTLTLTGAGTVTVRATQPGDAAYLPATPKSQSFAVKGATQSITFNPPAAATYGDAPIELTATASSGLPVTVELASAIPAGIASLDGTTLTILGVGKTIVRATQAGGSGFTAATAVTRTITVNKADLAVSFDSASRLVRQPNPAFPPHYIGFVNGDTEADLAATRPVGKTKATLASPEGRYPITFSGGLDAHYRFVAGEPAFLAVEGFSGAYEALLVDDSGIARGKLELLVPNNALTYTGTLHLASLPSPLSVRGNLTASDGASAQGSWTRTANPAKSISGLSLGFELAGDVLDGQLSVDGEPAFTIASGSRIFVRPVVAGKKQNAPWTGLHTLVLRDASPLVESDTRPIPLGAGHASVSVASSGVMTFKGKLADGTSLTGSARPAAISSDDASPSGLFRVFLRPYAKRLESFFSGELTLVSHPDQTRFPDRYYVPESPDLLAWAKAASPASPPDASYRAGFAAKVTVALDPWLPPLAATATVPAFTLPERLDLLPRGSGTDAPFGLDFLGEFLSDAEVLSLPASLTLRAKGSIILPSPNPRSFQLSVSPATGALTGSFSLSDQVKPPPARPVIRKVTISGTLRQGPAGSDSSLGHAHLLFDPVPGDTGASANERVSTELLLSK